MRQILTALICLLSLPALGGTVEFRAGAHAEPITPERLPSPVNGSMRGAFADSVNDPMYARSLALHDGRGELIICVVDSCMIPREVCDEVRRIVSGEIGVAPARLIISATHTHSAATMTPVFQSDPDPEYLATLPTRIARSMIKAHQNLEPAEIGWGKGSDPSHLFNRRWLMKEGQTYANPFGETTDRALMNPGFRNPRVSHPVGPIDSEITVIAVRAVTDRRPLAMLANYSLHYVGGNPAISADYFGAFAGYLEGLVKTAEVSVGRPPFVGIMSNGTSGDVNNVNYAEPEPVGRRPGEQLQTVARSLAVEVHRIYQNLVFRKRLELRSVEKDITLGVRKATPQELEAARKLLERTPRDKDGKYRELTAIYAREALLLDKYPDRVPVRLQAHRIGDLGIATIPGEVFTSIGLDLKRESPFAGHFTISLANGYNGYLPTPEQHRLGGYETWRARSSYLEVEASTRITVELRRMLRAIR
ncbi:MAG: hypothetical protein RIR52_2526 [Acidobacteriota bacterium]